MPEDRTAAHIAARLSHADFRALLGLDFTEQRNAREVLERSPAVYYSPGQEFRPDYDVVGMGHRLDALAERPHLVDRRRWNDGQRTYTITAIGIRVLDAAYAQDRLPTVPESFAGGRWSLSSLLQQATTTTEDT